MSAPETPCTLHGSAVSIGGAGVLIIGPSGSGKSSLALQLMAYGADLVADDQVTATVIGEQIILSSPPTLPPLIEARGVGLLPATRAESAVLRLVVDLSSNSNERLPDERTLQILGVAVKLLHASTACPMAAAVLQLVKGTTDWTRE